MDKPTISTGYSVAKASGYDMYEILSYIAEKENFDPSDYYGSCSHYENWCKSKGYTGKDSNGKKFMESTIWFKEYQSAPDGHKKKPPYKDFFDWFFYVFDSINVDDEISFKFNIQELLDGNPEEHIKVTLLHIKKHFGENIVCYLSAN